MNYSEQLTPEHHGDDSLDVTPDMALCDAVRCIRSGRFKPSAAFVLLLDNEDGAYSTRFYNSGMKVSEIIALMEIEKARLMDEFVNCKESPDDGDNWKNQ